jgi:tellurite resistance protein TerC
MFFALAGIMRLFAYLHYGLSAVLVFVGIKMMIADFYKIPTLVSLSVVLGTLLVSIIASLIQAKRVAMGDVPARHD